jgi:phage N-6-adenine-methyltransferase
LQYSRPSRHEGERSKPACYSGGLLPILASGLNNRFMAIGSALYSSRSEEWETPDGLFRKLDDRFHFTLDACATAANAKCKRFFSKDDNGLAQDWSAERVFMNPPYGKEIGLWMHKAKAEANRGALVVCLVHARTDTRWWHESVQNCADEIYFLRGRLRFLCAKKTKFTAPFPSAVVVYLPGTQDLQLGRPWRQHKTNEISIR